MKKNILTLAILIAVCLFTKTSSAQGQVNTDLAAKVQEVNELFKSIKMWDMEAISLDRFGSFKYQICLTPECNPFVSWDFYIKNLKTIEVEKYEDYVSVYFECTDGDCIVPAGYAPGGRYEKKKELHFLINDKKKGKELVAKLKALKEMEFDK